MFGNPHSQNPSSSLSSDKIDEVRGCTTPMRACPFSAHCLRLKPVVLVSRWQLSARIDVFSVSGGYGYQ